MTEADFGGRFVQTAVDSFGGIDIVVNNAGYAWDSILQKTSDGQWLAMLDVHLSAPFRVLRAAQPIIAAAAKRVLADLGQASRRSIINVSSVAGLAPIDQEAPRRGLAQPATNMNEVSDSSSI